MRRSCGVLALLLLAPACDGSKQLDRNANVGKVDLNQVVARASAGAGVPVPARPSAVAPAAVAAGYAWVGDWARRRSFCPIRRWRLTRTQAALPRGETCRIVSAQGDPLGGDRLRLACATAGMKTDELWFVKFEALDAIRVTRTTGAGVPDRIALVRCG